MRLCAGHRIAIGNLSIKIVGHRPMDVLDVGEDAAVVLWMEDAPVVLAEKPGPLAFGVASRLFFDLFDCRGPIDASFEVVEELSVSHGLEGR